MAVKKATAPAMAGELITCMHVVEDAVLTSHAPSYTIELSIVDDGLLSLLFLSSGSWLCPPDDDDFWLQCNE